MELTTADHDRGRIGKTYVYPVLSRRARGLSVGINLNPNKACNWRCVYCQVPGLVAGNAPKIDLERLERELREFLDPKVLGAWLAANAPEGSRVLRDLALSGDGESTSAAEFPDVVELIGRLMLEFGHAGRVPLTLITNGSLVQHPLVQAGLAGLARIGGRVWFKLDSATDEGMQALNSSALGAGKQRRNLVACAALAPTWIQTMALARNGLPPSAAERAAYLDLVRGLVRERVPLKGVLLYGFARTSYQPEASELSALPREWMEQFAFEIRAAGLPVEISL
ncbi:MAG: radical SAM protein [Planctomycetes bacterium]|nr:radical SAM protein [Planctomycetota bacterium]